MDYKAKTPPKYSQESRHSPLNLRTGPTSRADRALQILLIDNTAWEQLSSAEHHLLCSLPTPHGPLFAWLDAQIAEHGPQTWGAVSESLRGHTHKAVARKLVALVPDEIQNDAAELAAIVQKMHFDLETKIWHLNGIKFMLRLLLMGSLNSSGLLCRTSFSPLAFGLATCATSSMAQYSERAVVKPGLVISYEKFSFTVPAAGGHCKKTSPEGFFLTSFKLN